MIPVVLEKFWEWYWRDRNIANELRADFAAASKGWQELADGLRQEIQSLRRQLRYVRKRQHDCEAGRHIDNRKLAELAGEVARLKGLP